VSCGDAKCARIVRRLLGWDPCRAIQCGRLILDSTRLENLMVVALLHTAVLYSALSYSTPLQSTPVHCTVPLSTLLFSSLLYPFLLYSNPLLPTLLTLQFFSTLLTPHNNKTYEIELTYASPSMDLKSLTMAIPRPARL
jgi:hypothetical protein